MMVIGKNISGDQMTEIIISYPLQKDQYLSCRNFSFAAAGTEISPAAASRVDDAEINYDNQLRTKLRRR